MTQRDTILKELQDLKSILADASFQNPYQAPAGYFDGLADKILNRVRALEATSPSEELATLSPLLSSISKKMPYSVPAGYFDELGKKLEQTISTGNEETAQEELENLSPLLSQLKKKPTYTVPEGYFDELGKKLEQTISNGNEETAQKELESLSPLLSGLKKKTTYTVSEGYFENLQPAIGKETVVEKVKVVSITRQKWFRYAAAALVIGFVATIGFFALNKKEKIDPENKSFAWVKKNLKKVSTDEINKFVELANEETTDVAKNDGKDEINNLLKDVSDKEIQEFLNDTQLAESGTEDDLILN